MSNLSALTVKQLERAVAIKRQIEALQAELEGIVGNDSASTPAKKGRKPKQNVETKTEPSASIGASKEGKAPAISPKKRRKMSKEGRAKIAEAAKARWAKVKSGKATA
jgi:hypothetical protein